MTHHSSLRILILLEWWYPAGGTELAAWNLACALSKEFQVCLAICYVGDIPTLHPPWGLRLEVVRSKQVAGDINSLVANFKPDIIHSQHTTLIGMAGLRASRRRRIPYVLTNHILPEWKGPGRVVRNRIAWRGVVWLNNQATQVIAQSETVRTLLRRHGVKSEIEVLPSGIDLERYTVAPRRGRRERPVILFVGRLALDKGIDRLILAVARLKKERPLRLVLAGFAPLRGNILPDIERLVSEYGLNDSIEITGFLGPGSEKLVRRYREADVFVMPSDFETQGLAVVEAMAAGLPVVASRAGALSELVRDGENGILVAPGDSEGLAGALRRLLGDADLRHRFGMAGQETAAGYGLEESARRHGEIYRRLASKASGAPKP